MFFRFDLFLILVLIYSEFFSSVESIFTINELSELIRAKRLLIRKLPLLLSEESPENRNQWRGQSSPESRQTTVPRFERQTEKTNDRRDESGLDVINTLFDSKSLMNLIGLKQRVVANIALLIRRLIDEIAFTLRLILRIFTTPLGLDRDQKVPGVLSSDKPGDL